MRTAHIIIEPNVEVGTKTLAACGKEHKVKVLWANVSRETPICRECVDMLLEAVNDVNDQVANATRLAALAHSFMERTATQLTELNAMTELVAKAEDYVEERAAKAEKKADKAARKSAKKCSCLWIADGQRVLQLDCPVHDHYGPGDEIAGEDVSIDSFSSESEQEGDEQ